ncbi:MAG: response regulator [Acidobacteriota bacterium]
MKILIIEDQPTEAKLAHLVLDAAGHSVNSVEAAEQAFEAIKADRPQIILMDMVLPGMDGLALVQILKADPLTRDIHVVATTSYPERFSRAEALRAGCDAYLVKPVSTRTLPKTLSDVVEGGAENDPR